MHNRGLQYKHLQLYFLLEMVTCLSPWGPVVCLGQALEQAQVRERWAQQRIHVENKAATLTTVNRGFYPINYTGQATRA